MTVNPRFPTKIINAPSNTLERLHLRALEDQMVRRIDVLRCCTTDGHWKNQFGYSVLQDQAPHDTRRKSPYISAVSVLETLRLLAAWALG
jgi:hypothetical protein